MALTQMSSRLVAQMPRNHRSVDGALLVGHSRELLKHIRHANMADTGKARVLHIDKILDKVVDVEVELRVCTDLRLISHTNYTQASALSDSVHKQAHGWRSYSASKPVSGSPR